MNFEPTARVGPLLPVPEELWRSRLSRWRVTSSLDSLYWVIDSPDVVDLMQRWALPVH